MKPVQYFNDEYLDQCRGATPEQILEYLESFRLMQAQPAKSKLISIKIPSTLLDSFRRKCEFTGVRYQTQIKQLMNDWLQPGASDKGE
jgi:predicted DNA binding CopG/RHH family protein